MNRIELKPTNTSLRWARGRKISRGANRWSGNPLPQNLPFSTLLGQSFLNAHREPLEGPRLRGGQLEGDLFLSLKLLLSEPFPLLIGSWRAGTVGGGGKCRMWKGLRWCGAGGKKVRKSAFRCGGQVGVNLRRHFVFPCFNSGCFVTKMVLDESGDLNQVDVRVNETQEHRSASGVTMRDET